MHATLAALDTYPALCPCEPLRPVGDMQAVSYGARSRQYDVLDNAHEVDFEDENEWNQVNAVGRGWFRPKLPKLFRYEFSSDESKEARRRIDRRCMNYAGEDHFLRACDRVYINHFDQFTAEFGTASTTEVNKRWHCLLYTSPSPRDATLSRMPSSA